MPYGKGSLVDINTGARFEGRWSGHGEARGWYITPDGEKLKAKIDQGDIKVKVGLFRSETVGKFDTLEILASMSVKG